MNDNSVSSLIYETIKTTIICGGFTYLFFLLSKLTYRSGLELKPGEKSNDWSYKIRKVETSAITFILGTICLFITITNIIYMVGKMFNTDINFNILENLDFSFFNNLLNEIGKFLTPIFTFIEYQNSQLTTYYSYKDSYDKMPHIVTPFFKSGQFISKIS
jgi:hypothetical protein